MLVALAGLFFAGTWLAFASRGANGIRQSFLYASAIHTLCVVLATELLSVLGLLRLPALGLFWGAAVALVAAYLWFRADRSAIQRACGKAWKRARVWPIQLSIVALVLAATLLTALVAPPNSWDSMSYHMSRVAMWLQQGSVAHYQVPYLPQLIHPPLTEWHILHLQILADGDRFANVVQWMAFAGCGIAASLVARELKAGFGVQLLAAVIVLTLPTGVLQASSSLNDIMVAYWLPVMALFVIQYIKTPTTLRLCFCGLALGFALLCKGTGYIFAAPIGAVLFLRGFGVDKTLKGRMRLVAAGAAIVAMALLLNAGHYARNLALFDNPLTHGPSGHVNHHFNVLVTLSNLVRGSALHLGVPNDSVNMLTLDLIRHVFGEEIDAVPGATLGLPFLQRGIHWSQNEAFAGNFFHFWALLASALGVLMLRRHVGFRGWPATVALALVFGAVTFCSLIQWDFYGARRHMPLFILGAPIIVLFLASMARSLLQRYRKILKREDTDRVDVVLAVVEGRLSHLEAAGRLGLGVKQVKGLARRYRELGRAGLASGPDAGIAPRDSQGRRFNAIVAVLFLLAVSPWLVWNVHRPLYASPSHPAYAGETKSVFQADRTHMYFSARPWVRDPYLRAIAYLAELEPTEIGLYMNADDFDYPLFPLFKDRLGVVPRIEHVGVSNISAALADSSFAPKYVFSTRGAIDLIGNATYRQATPVVTSPMGDAVAILTKVDSDPP